MDSTVAFSCTQSVLADSPHLNLIGESEAFKRVLGLIQRLSSCDATVLIRGETGTGKELYARAIHYLSVRRTAPFIAVNCGAIPDSLVESEFFGHMRGAFTDAKHTHAGAIRQAEGGTLFLDEVDTLSAHSQVALLRFLQDYEYRPLGATAPKSADIRVLAATNSDLERLVANGAYRQDLLYRLNVLSVHLPPLRERGDDTVLLAQAFLRRLSVQYGTPSRSLHPDSLAFLREYAWPGNVRELENLIQRAFLLSDDDIINITSATDDGARGDGDTFKALTDDCFQAAKARAIARFERAYISELLLRTRGNISLAARMSGKERSRLGKLLKKHGLDRQHFFRES
jgi:two-component system, NtrC family, response regulator GlrR